MSQLLDLALRMDEWMDGRTEPNPWDTSTSAEVQQFIITIIIAMGSRFSGLLFRNIQIIFRALIKFSEIPKVYVIKVYNKKEYVTKKIQISKKTFEGPTCRVATKSACHFLLCGQRKQSH